MILQLSSEESATDTVTVIFLDFGRTAVVEKRDVFDLPASLGKLAWQTAHCTLAGVRRTLVTANWWG